MLGAGRKRFVQLCRQRMTTATSSRMKEYSMRQTKFPPILLQSFSSTPPSTTENVDDLFALFGFPRKFLLDEAALQSSYKKLMVEVHPDKNQSKSAEEKALLEERASQITHAYQVLKLPHTRALHSLELIGSPIEEHTSSARLVGPEFLMEIMEFRESIDRLPAAYEGADDESLQDLHALLDYAQERIQHILEGLDQALFQPGDSVTDADQALKLTAQLQYWNRIEETIREKL